jgi:pimeloyl-ACP methyl ester carboxylesterase
MPQLRGFRFRVAVYISLEGMTTLVLLPGMDGTGDLFGPFVDTVGVRTQVVRYPTSGALGYEELEHLVTSQLPTDEPYVLLGESFSGPIAISIAARQPPLLRGLILCCSFAKNPRPALSPLRSLVKWLPDRPPLAPLEWFLAGRFASPQVREALARALAQVSPAALRARMTAVIAVDVVPVLSSISVPILYLRALEDRVVPFSASEIILGKVPSVKRLDLAAPHFLLQTVPKEAGSAVHQFMREVEHAL